MPLLQSIVHRLDPTLDGERLTLAAAPGSSESGDDPVMSSLVGALNDTYNTKPKGWGALPKRANRPGRWPCGCAITLRVTKALLNSQLRWLSVSLSNFKSSCR
ncbi:hypothetical protein HSBAA_56680 [Vreelandella sulfidaeris]|uniref:Uncharacterized protein n=1 Tax=Vreelandella sulfidaeris TaxID=115553 RepID=A0A455UDM6_9GAMM|nr:hypothetical protein HSBAA_56680 [Halomonas sulfidaeris]